MSPSEGVQGVTAIAGAAATVAVDGTAVTLPAPQPAHDLIPMIAKNPKPSRTAPAVQLSFFFLASAAAVGGGVPQAGSRPRTGRLGGRI